MSDITQIAESIPFSSKDINSINAARQQAAAINATINKILGDPPHAARHEHFSWLHLEVDRIEAELIDNPSHANAERLHAAIVRFDQAKQSQERIGGALGIAGQRISQSISGIVQGHLAKVQSRIETEATSRRAELAATRHGLFNNSDESRALEARVQALLADLASVRTEAAQDPLGWVMREGLMDHEPEQAGDEQAA